MDAEFQNVLGDESVSNQEVFDGLTSIGSNEDPFVLTTAAAVAGATKRMQMILDGNGDRVAFHLLVELVRAVPTDVPPELTQAVLNDDFLTALGRAFSYFLKIQAPGVDDALSLVLRCVQDLCYLSYRDKNKQNVLGKTRCGEFFVERVLAVFDKRGSLPPILGRQATSTLLDLMTNSKCNQSKMMKQEKECKKLFEDYLPTCGDYSMQIDIVEIMYRCSLSKTAHFSSVLPEKVRDCFDALVRRPPKGIDLGAELRSVLFLYNTSLEKFASVHMFEAISISMETKLEGIKIANQWMNVGSEHVSVYVAHEEDDPDVPPDVLDIFYDNIGKHSLTEASGGNWELRLVCKEAPTSMHFKIKEDEFRICILLPKADLLHLSKLVPGLQVPGKSTGKLPKVSWALNAKCSALSFTKTFTAHRGSSTHQSVSNLNPSNRISSAPLPAEGPQPPIPERPPVNPSLEAWKGERTEGLPIRRRSTLASDRKSAQQPSPNPTNNGDISKENNGAQEFLSKNEVGEKNGLSEAGGLGREEQGRKKQQGATVVGDSGKAVRDEKLLECLSGDGGDDGKLDEKEFDGGARKDGGAASGVRSGKDFRNGVDGEEEDEIAELEKEKDGRWNTSREAKTERRPISESDAFPVRKFNYIPVDPPSKPKKGVKKHKKGKNPKADQQTVPDKEKKTPDVQPSLPTSAGEQNMDTCRGPSTKENAPSIVKKGNAGVRTYGLKHRSVMGEQPKVPVQGKRYTACLTGYLRPSKCTDQSMDGRGLRKSLHGVLEPTLGKVTLNQQPERDEMEGVENEGGKQGESQAINTNTKNVEATCDGFGEVDPSMEPGTGEMELDLKEGCGPPHLGEKTKAPGPFKSTKENEKAPRKGGTTPQPYEFVVEKENKKVRKQGTGKKQSRKQGKNPEEGGKCVGIQTEGIEFRGNAEIETRSVGTCTDENMDTAKSRQFAFKLGNRPESSYPKAGGGISLGPLKEFRLSSSENEQEGMGEERKLKLWRDLNMLGESSEEESESLTPAWKGKIKTPSWMQGKKRPLALNLAAESGGGGNSSQEDWMDPTTEHGNQGFIHANGKDVVPTPSRSQGKQTTKSTFYQVETLTHGSGGAKMDNSGQGEMPITPGESFIRRVHFRSQECLGDDDISMGNCGSDIEALKRALGTKSEFNSTPISFPGQGVGGSALSRKDTGGTSTAFRLRGSGVNEISSQEGGVDAQPASKRLGCGGDDDETGGTDQEYELLGHVVKKMLKSKRENARQKQRAIIKEVQTKLGESDKKLQTQIKRDATALSNVCQEGFCSMTTKLEDLSTCIEGIRNKLQVDLERLAEDAKDLRDQTKQAGQSIHAVVEKKRSNLKRKIEQMNEGHDQLLAEAEAKIRKTKSRASKVPELATIFKSFM